MSFLLLSLLYLLSGITPRSHDDHIGPKLGKSAHRFEDKITFHLYNKDNPERDHELHTNDPKSLASSGMTLRKPTKFIIHSWTDDKDVPWIKEMREVMTSTGRWNVIVVDWAPLSHAVFNDAYEHTTLVGEKLSNFTLFLMRSGKVSLRGLHFIGHGLGALAAGHAGRELRRRSGKSISRITALDPTISPRRVFNRNGFLMGDESNNGEIGIGKKDARFVDVIHTNGDGFGTMRALGEVDYYPNGGRSQPGCASAICSHVRACEYWSASVRRALVFKAYNYDLWGDYLKGRSRELMHYPMGIAANPTIPSGIYFLETTDDPPFVYTKHKFIRK